MILTVNKQRCQFLNECQSFHFLFFHSFQLLFSFISPLLCCFNGLLFISLFLFRYVIHFVDFLFPLDSVNQSEVMFSLSNGNTNSNGNEKKQHYLFLFISHTEETIIGKVLYILSLLITHCITFVELVFYCYCCFFTYHSLFIFRYFTFFHFFSLLISCIHLLHQYFHTTQYQEEDKLHQNSISQLSSILHSHFIQKQCKNVEITFVFTSSKYYLHLLHSNQLQSFRHSKDSYCFIFNDISTRLSEITSSKSDISIKSNSIFFNANTSLNNILFDCCDTFASLISSSSKSSPFSISYSSFISSYLLSTSFCSCNFTSLLSNSQSIQSSLLLHFIDKLIERIDFI